MFAKPDFDDLLDDMSAYDGLLLKHSGVHLADSRVVEIGIGQRPYRFMAVRGLGADVWGIDLDRPVVGFSLRSFVDNLKANGALRALKTAARVIAFDSPDRAAFSTAFVERYGRSPMLDNDRIILGSAGSSDAWRMTRQPVDLIFSEDVFEHIPRDELESVLRHMRTALAEDGIAVISPMVFTGICGGHTTEWYTDDVLRQTPKRTPAWGHLSGECENPDTYLNQLSRDDYRQLFKKHFRIVSEAVALPDLGRSYLTPERRRKLRDYSDDELFSNKVRFVLAHK